MGKGNNRSRGCWHLSYRGTSHVWHNVVDVRQSCGFAKKAFPRKSKHVTQLDGFGPPNIDLAPIYVLFDHPLHKMLLQVEVHHSYLMSIHCFWSLWSTAKIRELLSNVGAKNRSRRDHQSCWVRPSPNASRNHSCYPTSVGVMRVTGCIQNMICFPEPWENMQLSADFSIGP